MLNIPPPLFAVIVIYTVSISWVFGVLLLGDIQRRMRLKRQPDTIMAVADAALAERPELADDTEAVARTVALTDAAIDGALVLVAADLQARPDVSTLARIEVERLLIEIDRCVECYRHGQDITKDAPKERP